MFYWLTELTPELAAFNVFRYITFRSAGAAITALLISFIIGPYIIRSLKRRQVKEEIRPDGLHN